jgi:non-specific serine/threonine protein kinase/serine/threonine-protein kinase
VRCGPYRILREFARGGMGVVYLGARADDQFEKTVAIKIISGHLLHPAALRRFHDERRILAMLDHPNIGRLLDAGATETGVPYVVMDYIDGQPLDEYCATRAVPIAGRVALMIKVCAAVQHSHQHLVVHRDIKARNVLVTPDGEPKLLDFGIAKLLDSTGIDTSVTRTGLRTLTPDSASPEQVRGEPVTVLTDVYSLGVLLYRLLAERSPYRGSMTTESSIARAICEEEPIVPSSAAAAEPSASAEDLAAARHRARELRGDLDLITLKALDKDPRRRYGSVEQLAQDLQRHLDGRPIVAAPDSWGYRTRKFVARHRGAVGAAALLTLSLAAGIAATGWEVHVARQERNRAERRFNDVRRLANSFLFEFHDAIEGLPGSTRARELVVRRALQYLDSLANESAHDPSLQRELASAYERVGDVQGLPSFANLGDTPGAIRSHLAALTLREPLAASSPSDPALTRELATTHIHLSSLLEVTSQLPAAIDHARRALAIRVALQSSGPDGVDDRVALAAGYHQVGRVMSATGDWKAALDSAQREAAVFESILAADPGSSRAQRNAAIGYRQLGAHLERARDRDAALANYRKAVALDERRAAASPTDRQAHLDLSFDYGAIGYLLSTQGNVEEALRSYAQALSLREAAAAADPNDVEAIEAVGRAHLSIGQVLRRAGRAPEAISEFQKALPIALKRSSADPVNRSTGDHVANVYGALAGVNAERAATTTDRAESARAYRAARGWAQEALAIRTVHRASGTTPSSAQSEIDSLTALIAKCDLALNGLATVSPPAGGLRRR